MNADRKYAQAGVTLVETLVALAVMGFVISGLLVLVGQNTRFAAAMEDKTYAAVAADNLMVEALTLTSALEIGEIEGGVSVGDRPMQYRRVVSEAGVEGVLRIDIEITAPQSDQVLAGAVSLRRAK